MSLKQLNGFAFGFMENNKKNFHVSVNDNNTINL